MPDASKRISIESSRQVNRVTPEGKVATYQQVVWWIYGRGPYELLFLLPDTSIDQIRTAIERETQRHIDTVNLF